MSALLFETKEKTRTAIPASEKKSGLILPILAFLVGFVPALLHNLLFCESRIMLATDGKHYLHTVSTLLEFLKEHLGTSSAGSFLSNSELAGHVMLDGPLMSLFYAPVFLALNKIPTPRDWNVLACGQSFFHACSTMLLSLVVLRLTGSRIFASMAALIYGLYPPAILQTGHFMSELPVNSLLLVLLLCLTGKNKNVFSFAAAGFSTALLILSKPALIPAVTLAAAWAIIKHVPANNLTATGRTGVTPSDNPSLILSFLKTRQSIIGSFIVGSILVLLPWSFFSYKTSGQFVPTAQRQPLYNVSTGWNVEADGWAFNPHPPLTDMFCDADGPLAAATGIWISHPQESFRLALSKVSRLAACPWNDFKGRALGLDENAQILIHRLILACAVFGSAIFWLHGRRLLDGNKRLILELSMGIVTLHLSYLMVECQPRYAFTALPFSSLLAVYGIWQASRLSFHDENRRFVIISSVVSTLSLTAFLLHAENLSKAVDPGALKEKSHALSMHDKLEKDIDLSAIKKPRAIKSVFLLVDGDKHLDKCRLELNGVQLKQRLVPTMQFDAAHYQIYDQLREFAPAMRVSVDDFRQWRAIVLDPELINWQGKNKIVLESLAKSATVYGDRRQNRRAFSPDYCNYGLLAASPLAAGAETRYTEPLLSAAVKQESFQSNKNEIRSSLKDSLRIKLMLVLPDQAVPYESPMSNGSSATAENKPGSQSPDSPLSAKPRDAALNSNTPSQIPTIIDVKRESFDRMLWDNNSSDCLRINKVILYAARTVAAEIFLPKTRTASHLQISIKGELKALKNAGDVGMLCALKGKNGRVQIIGRAPRALEAKSAWHSFEISDTVPLEHMGNGAEALELALYPCPWMEGQYGVSRRACDAVFRNIKVELKPTELPPISGRRIIY